MGAEIAIAIELELDWREFDSFFLLVKLEGGQFPQGYYVSNGKPCRYHLQKVIKERAWRAGQAGMRVISGISECSEKPNVEKLKKRILAYKAVVMSCLRQVIIETEVIFSG